MIFPDDYRSVGMKDEETRRDRVYFSTQYLIIRQGPRLYRVSSRGSGFMREVEDAELLASGSEIVFYPERLDTRNRALLIETADGVCRREGASTVVFQGLDEHVTFVKDPDPSAVLTIEVLDISPPDPPWLVHTIGCLEACGVFGDLTVRFRPRILDLKGFRGDGVYYPCRASGLGRSLDCDCVVHSNPRIVGCEVSREIFFASAGSREHEFVNICPVTGQEGALQPEGPFITRCCRSERGGLTRRSGQTGMVVHWGDGPWRIAEAVRCLVEELRG